MFRTKRSEFDTLVRAFSPELFRYAYWMCRNRSTAEDLVQETFARAWAAWGRIRDPGAAKNWLYTILRREHARLYERKQLELVDEQDLDAIEDERLDAPAVAIDLRRALAALPGGYRDALLLQVIGGFSCAEIAQIME